MNQLNIIECLDSEDLVLENRASLGLNPRDAALLGQGALKAIQEGFYTLEDGTRVDWGEAVKGCRSLARSFPPDAPLAAISTCDLPAATRVQVVNQTTLVAAQRMHHPGRRLLALNFANGLQPGGGFLTGARAQEEVLCRSSALYTTLDGDKMYSAHKGRPHPDSTDWAILSPRVPVFRTDAGITVPWWPLDVITCAAPFAPAIGSERASELLRLRIHRVLAIAAAHDYDSLVLGAWGCGAFGNDPFRTAFDFREALEGPFAGRFSDVTFAITDWSPERRFLGPFRDTFEES